MGFEIGTLTTDSMCTVKQNLIFVHFTTGSELPDTGFSKAFFSFRVPFCTPLFQNLLEDLKLYCGCTLGMAGLPKTESNMPK